tara:strand:- start:5 stop:178 length:174 start_codon:yes stop_codon:yes gene_type:complete
MKIDFLIQLIKIILENLYHAKLEALMIADSAGISRSSSFLKIKVQAQYIRKIKMDYN